jgi:hypothetical protein
MPPAIVAAVVTYGAQLAIGAEIAVALKLAMVTFVVSGAAYLMAENKAKSAFQNQSTGRMVSRRDPISPQRVIYGRVRAGGPVVYMETTSVSNEYLHLVIVLAAHEVNDIEKIYFDDKEVTLDANGDATDAIYAGYVRIKKALGTDNQAAFADLVAESNGYWTANHRLLGRAAIYVRLKFSTDVFPNGIPNITAIVQGKKLYDPRTLTTTYSTNPALVIYDYLSNARYGLGFAAAEIDSAAAIAAANICDETVPLAAGGTEARYAANGTFDTAETPEDILNKLVTAMAGKLIYTNGKWVILAGAYNTPTITLDEDDLRSGMRIKTKVSRAQQFNSIKGLFASPDNLWQPTDFPPIKSTTYIAQDNNQQVWKDISLPFTTSSSMAQRLAKIDLLKSRQEITLSYPAKLTAMNVQVGDVVYINNTRLGWSNKPFEVVGNTIAFEAQDNAPLIGFDLDLRETSSTVYDWQTSEESALDPAPNTNLPNPFSIIAPGIATFDELRAESETIVTTLVVNVTGGGFFRDRYEVEAKISTASDYTNLGQASGNIFELKGVVDGATYNVRARSISTIGVASAYTTKNHVIVGKTAPPSDVTGFSANIIEGDAHLSWTPVADLDLSHYKIRFSPTTTAATYSNGVDLVEKVSRPAASVVVPALTGTYMIKAYDKLNNQSLNAATIVNLVPKAVYQNVITTITESPSFSGSKTDCEVVSSRLQLSNGETSGEYLFNNTIDLTQIYTSKLSADLSVLREDFVNTFDDAGGLFDDRSGLFDGDIDQFDDISVELYISTTDDNPAGTPTWSAYRKFFAGEYRARAFRFKAVLSSATTAASPAIDSLSVSCDMPDRVAFDNDIVSGTSAYAVTYSPAFKESPAVAISAQNMATGDYFTLTSKSRTGFTIQFFNSSNTAVSRTFDWVARGFGEQI